VRSEGRLASLDPTPGSTIVRRFAGPVATELAILHRPDGRSPDPAHQAEAAYRALAAVLAAHAASFGDLTCETLFLRDVRRDLPLVLDVRTRVLADLRQSAWSPSPSFIEQAPAARGARFELSASAVVPHRRDAWSVRDVRAASTCGCRGCVRSGARLVRLGDQTSLHTTNVHGAGADPLEQAWSMFCAAERLLERVGMTFRDVVRTWIDVRDVDRDYDALNRARRAFFRRCGIEQRPASTGVQGMPAGPHDFALRLHAVKIPHRRDVTVMSTPLLNEAWSYGADFSRGLRVAERNKVALHVSGTASVDEAGRTAHVGSLEAQVDRMLQNVASLLARHGAGFADLVSGVVYLRDRADAPVVRSMLHDHGFDGFPCALVEAALCRPELLCEGEVLAMLPLAAGEA